MNAEQLYNAVRNSNADGRPNKMAADSAYLDYFKSHCYHPITEWVFDSHAGQFVKKQLPCGTCYHCRETKVNEWVTRLYAHCEDYKYIYFTTLTYKSIPQNPNEYDTYLLKYLEDAYWHLDNNNSTKNYCYRPCVLVKKHYQDFLKRLRKYTGIKHISMFGCGEYGHNFGMPHFHFILFSHEPITAKHVHRAWGLVLAKNLDSKVSKSSNEYYKNKKFVSFGRIEHDDLVQNGTIADKVTIDNQQYNATHAFSYVAKYIGKKEYNKSRVTYYVNFINSNYNNYDFQKTTRPTAEVEDLAPASLYKRYSPFIICSRGVPIGSLYIKRHIGEMAQGVYCRPPLQDKNFIVPSYFRQKAAEYIFGLRRISSLGSISRGNLLAMASALGDYCSSQVFNLARSSTCLDRTPDNHLPIVNVTPQRISEQLNSPDALVDVCTRSRFLIFWDDLKLTLYVNEYKHSRKEKEWKKIATHSIYDFANHYLTQMHTDFLEYLKVKRMQHESELYFNFFKDYYHKFYNLDNLEPLKDQFEKNTTEYLKQKTIIRYERKSLHTSL